MDLLVAENCYALLRGFFVGYKNLGAPRLLRGGHGAAANEMEMKQPKKESGRLEQFSNRRCNSKQEIVDLFRFAGNVAVLSPMRR